MPYVENFEEFAARQDCPSLIVRNRHLFENGAQATAAGNFLDPPADPQQKLKLRIEYVQAVYDNAKRDFKQLKEYIGTQASWHAMGAGPAPPERATRDLRKLRYKCFALRGKLDKLQKRLRQQPEVAQALQYQQQRDAERRAASQIVEEINSINI